MDVQRGLSPLHVAVIEQRHKMVSTLLHYRESLGLDVNVRSTSVSHPTALRIQSEIIVVIHVHVPLSLVKQG